jgi:hypothetical protein
VKILQVLYILSLGIDKFFDDMIPICHLRCLGRGRDQVFWVRLKLDEKSPLLGQIEDIIDNLRDLYQHWSVHASTIRGDAVSRSRISKAHLYKSTCVIAHEIRYDETFCRGDLEFVHACLYKLENGNF